MKKFNTPDLPYDYNALEPYIDEPTMKVHHDKHHVGYTTKLNNALEKHSQFFEKTPEEILANLSEVPEEIRTAVKNNAGGHVHHNIFWETMAPATESGKPENDLAETISKKFGSFDKFKEQMTQAAATLFGAGWAWLVLDKNKELAIVQTPNQDSPYSQDQIPLFGIDVWEHAYYLKYKNKRPEYIENFWHIINWKAVSEKYQTNK